MLCSDKFQSNTIFRTGWVVKDKKIQRLHLENMIPVIGRKYFIHFHKCNVCVCVILFQSFN